MGEAILQTEDDLKEFGVYDLFTRGDYTLCLAVLGDADSDEALIVKLRCLVRLGYWNQAIRADVLSRVNRTVGCAKISACALVATACNRANMRLPAERYIREGYRVAESMDAGPKDTAELRYYHALLCWSSNRIDEAETLIRELLDAPGWQLRAHAVLSWIAASRGNLNAQLELLGEAVQHEDDAWTRGVVLESYSELACSLYRPQHGKIIERLAKELRWTDDMRPQQFWTYHHLGWLAAVSGYDLKANEFFCKCADVAKHDSAMRIIAAYDLSLHAHYLGERKTAEEKCKEAMQLVGRASFTTDRVERLALILMTIAAARLNFVEDAELCWNTYEAIQTRITPIIAYGLGDRRLYAMEQYALGWLERARGKTTKALTHFGAALDVWNDIGYYWRAAVTAISMNQISHRPKALDEASVHTDRYFPRAWFARELTELHQRMGNPILQNLSPQKSAVISHLLRGRSYRDIATEMGTTETTIRRHVHELIARFSPEDRTRAALCEQLRLLGAK